MARTKQTNADAEERRRTERELAEAAEVCREYERRAVAGIHGFSNAAWMGTRAHPSQGGLAGLALRAAN